MTDLEKTDSKTQGRWTKAEHSKFLLGMGFLLFRLGDVWERLEKDRGPHRDQKRRPDTITCTKVFPQNEKITRRRPIARITSASTFKTIRN